MTDVTAFVPPLPTAPAAQGLYDPRHEHDACGVGFVAHVKGKKSHSIIEQGLKILDNLSHRGATGYDALLGDGAGILIQLPDAHLRRVCGKQGMTLPALGQYGVGMVFLPREPASRMACEQEIERAIDAEGQALLGWRDVPTDNNGLSPATIAVEPLIRQVFVARGLGASGAGAMTQDDLERKLYIIRKRSGHAIQALQLRHGKEFYVPSFSTRTIVYKGMLLADQVGKYYLDLRDPSMTTALALVHQRFSNLPDLGPGASVSDDCAQRRDQHPARQRQLDSRTPAGDCVTGIEGRPEKNLAADLRRSIRFRQL